MSEATAWERWSLRDLHTSRTASQLSRQQRAKPQQAADEPLQAERHRWRKEAEDLGYQAGYTLGLEQGTLAGYQQGLAQGYQEGLSQGLADGLRQAEAQMQAAAQQALQEQAPQWNALFHAAEAMLSHLEDAAAQATIELAVCIAEQIVQHEIHSDSIYVEQLAQRLLQSHQTADHASLHLVAHPDDLPTLRALLETLKSSALVTADTGMLRGGLRLRTAEGSIEASLESRWRAVLKSLNLPDILHAMDATRSKRTSCL